ncbi:hypothetical protein N865_15290 [Intrasporangium oryzae NRRL B-24470]|uniref:Uncharacterized protein n=1 Tax=Intrasporangium oryzae NRRL B-24470 TaxID=1386089 RepID=W9G681_9MICO|nr:hypothetical protein [Intrasporangium oryzae]EWT01681.1 hypothetical protein N865_15290 [Intrasporangium oryzae NRRL B-24470]
MARHGFARLPRAREALGPLEAALAATRWPERESGLVDALRVLGRLQAEVGLPMVDDPVEPFWDRPYRGVRAACVTLIEDSVTDPVVRALPRGVGSVEQWSDNVDVLMRPASATHREAVNRA